MLRRILVGALAVTAACSDGSPGAPDGSAGPVDSGRAGGGDASAGDASAVVDASVDCDGGALVDDAAVDGGTGDAGRSDSGVDAGAPPIPCEPMGTPFGGGAGTADDPHLICSEAQLRRLEGATEGVFAALARNLEVGTTWAPIQEFGGSLDGNGFSIRGLEVREPGEGGIGALIEVLSGSVRSVHVRAPLVEGNTSVGGVFGRLLEATVEDVHVTDCDVTAQNARSGGLAGTAADSTIRDVSVSGAVRSPRRSIAFTSLLVGDVSDSTLERITVRGSVEADAAGSAGLIGISGGAVTVRDVLIEAQVTGGGAAGIVGYLNNTTLQLENVVVGGTLTTRAPRPAGGVVGFGVRRGATASLSLRNVLVKARLAGPSTCAMGWEGLGVAPTVSSTASIFVSDRAPADGADCLPSPLTEIDEGMLTNPATFAGWPSPPFVFAAGMEPSLVP